MVLRWLQEQKAHGWPRIAFIAWSIYAHASGVLLLSLGFAVLLVYSYDQAVPVFEHSKTVQPRLLTPIVPRGSQFSYVVTTRQNQSCPGDIITTFTSVTDKTSQVPAVVTLRRPVTRFDVGSFRSFPVLVDIPETVWPGKWQVNISADSRCPLRNVISHIATFQLEVTP